MSVDLDYTRASGEEVRARLFPRPKRVFDEEQRIEVDGPTPIPMPVAISYRPTEEVRRDLIFVRVRAIQQLGSDPAAGVPPDDAVPVRAFGPDVSPDYKGWTVVIDLSDNAGLPYVLDLSLGHDPLEDAEVLGTDPPLLALLRAVAGVGKALR